MTVSFPTNQVGTYSEWVTKYDEWKGFWGNVNSFYEAYPRHEHVWYSFKYPPVKGDRRSATHYFRCVGRTLSNKPGIDGADGRDHNGDYSYRRSYYMSAYWFHLEHMRWYFPGWAPFRDNCIAEAIVHARNKARRGRVQNGASIGEARRTAGMIADGAHTVLNAWKAFKRGQFNQIPRILGMNRRDIANGSYPANSWLAYQYGWKPFLGSVYDNVQLLDRLLREDDATFTVQHSLKRDETFTRDDGSIGCTLNGTCKVKVGFTCKVLDSFVDGLDTSGVLNPLSIAWELVPFSFVVDWFVPVGAVLESLTATIGLQLLTGYQTMVDDQDVKVKMVSPRTGSPLYYRVLDPGDFHVKLFTFERVPLRDFPVPRLYANLNPFSTQRIISAAALIRQQLR